jgi:hypothetical protein
MSGRNVVSSVDFLANPDGEGIFAWLDNYCRQYPLRKVETGARALVIELLGGVK